MESKTLKIDGVEYVRKDNYNPAEKVDGMEYVIIRTYAAGVHAGYLKSKEYTLAGTIVELVNARRLWYWSGASSISQLAMEGVKNQSDCKFPCELPSIELKAIEIVPCTEEARLNIREVEIWKQ